jgi:hypothetical protein
VLREIKDVRQERGTGRRRWFESDGFDLVVWLDSHDTVDGFQICYNGDQGERALTWRRSEGFVHSAVDMGDDTPLKNQTPVLIPDGNVPWEDLLRRFEAHSGSLEPELRQVVRERLADKAGASAI